MNNLGVKKNAAQAAGQRVTAANTAITNAGAAVDAAEVQLAGAIAALEAVKGANSTAVAAKVQGLRDIKSELNELDDSLKNLATYAGGNAFLEGAFGFKPDTTSNNNRNRTVNKSNLESALGALGKISETLNNANKVTQLNHKKRNGAPSRQQVIKALLAGIEKLTQNVESNHKASLGAADAAKAQADAAQAEAKQRAANAQEEKAAANANKQIKNNELKQLTTSVIKKFNDNLAKLTLKAKDVINQNPVEANGGTSGGAFRSAAGAVRAAVGMGGRQNGGASLEEGRPVTPTGGNRMNVNAIKEQYPQLTPVLQRKEIVPNALGNSERSAIKALELKNEKLNTMNLTNAQKNFIKGLRNA